MKLTPRAQILVFTGLALVRQCSAFLSRSSSGRRHGLFSISEWRDLIFDFPGTGDDRRIGTESGAPPREINILPFPYDQVLLQGETKQLRLYEDRFTKLFENTMEKHCGIVAMGLLANTGIVSKTLLCEIEAYNRMEGFGIFVTIRVVGRAELIEVTQQEPFIKAVCLEMSDKIPPNLELPNLLAQGIEESMKNLSKMEALLFKKAEETEEGAGGGEMQRRINIAKLVCHIFPIPLFHLACCCIFSQSRRSHRVYCFPRYFCNVG